MRNPDYSGCFIILTWEKHTTVWDHDQNLMRRMLYFNRSCWPVKASPFHVCCISFGLVQVAKPILCALMDKAGRCRFLVHDVGESEILAVLSRFGIMKSMLPVEMGGTVKLDLPAWIAHRRAVEMEEI